jgi:hypothetical protein
VNDGSDQGLRNRGGFGGTGVTHHPVKPTEPPAAPVLPARSPLALIYLPPILAEEPEGELELVGQKLAVALDRQGVHGGRRYRTATEFVEVRGRKEKICRLFCTEPDGAPERPLADLFELDYRPKLLARYREGRLISKCVLAGMGMLEMGRRLAWQLFRPKRLVLAGVERFQPVVALAGLVLVAAYFVMLVVGAAKIVSLAWREEQAGGKPSGSVADPVVAVTNVGPWNDGLLPGTNGWALWTNRLTGVTNVWLVKTNVTLVRTNGFFGATNWGFGLTNVAGTNLTFTNWGMQSTNWGPFGPPRPRPPKPWWERFRDWWRDLFSSALAPLRWFYSVAEYSLVALVALGLLNKDRGKLSELIRQMSEEMLAFVYYLSFADRRAEITGMVDEFVEELTEPADSYPHCAVLSYSFGSIVALDALFPADEVRARRLDRVETLVTIGSPFDFVVTYWPDYFANRSRRHKPPAAWLNVYSPVDVLGTRFNKQTSQGSGTKTDRPPPPAAPGLENSFNAPGRLAVGPTKEFAFRENFVAEQLSWTDAFTLLGLRAHSMYWSREENHERNCYHLLVADLFPDEVKQQP